MRKYYQAADGALRESLAWRASDNILAVTISGTNPAGNSCAWSIDDLSTNTAAGVPAPATLVLGLLGLAGTALARNRRHAKA